MVLIIIWIVLSILVASIGSKRKIGFGGVLLISILFSPLIGLIVALISEKHSETLMKLKIAYDAGNITKERYAMEVRKIYPSKEDKQNMTTGYAITFGVIFLIYLAWLFFRQ